MISERLKQAVEYANYFYYSKPMTVVNVKKVKLPIIPPLKKLTTEEGYSFPIRSSHGLLHALSAMELVEKIDATYEKYIPEYKEALEAIGIRYRIDKDEFLELIQAAVLFHDSARQGDGSDLWDAESAEACKQFLIDEWQVNEELAKFISDTIRYKDDPEKFIARHRFHRSVDVARQLVNMADALEVIRTRDVFKVEKLPIAQHHDITSKIMVEDIIPNLVEPHRQLIIEQGRLAKGGRIEYNGDNCQPIDSAKADVDDVRMAAAYLDKCRKYDLSILEIDTNNFNLVIERALRGIRTYREEHKTSGIQLFHNGLFSPRYHGKLGRSRAEYYEDYLSRDVSPAKKAVILYALLSSAQGQTLKDAVLGSFNQINREIVLAQLGMLVKMMNSNQGLDVINRHIMYIVSEADDLNIKEKEIAIFVDNALKQK